MELVILATAFALSIGTSIALTPLLGSLAIKRGWLDAPDTDRKLHVRAVPAVGGISIFAGVVVGFVYLGLASGDLPFDLPSLSLPLVVGLLAMVATGFWDDVKGLGFKSKFLVQIVVAYILISAGYRINLSSLPFIHDDPFAEALISIPLTLLWIVGTINAVNLIDGLDGLAGGVVLIAFACLAAVFGLNGDIGLAVIAIVVVGAILGFLAFNFSPASVFMGDAGSLFLGCLLAVYSLSGPAHTDPLMGFIVPVVALGLPLLDTGLSLVRRIASGKSAFAPDHDHIHHRLSRRWPQLQAVLVLYVAAGVFGISAVLISQLAPLLGFSVFAITVAASGGGLIVLGYLRLRAADTATANVIENAGLDEQVATEPAGSIGGDGRARSQSTELGNIVVTPHVVDLPTQESSTVRGLPEVDDAAANRKRIKMLARGVAESKRLEREMLELSTRIVAAEGLSIAELDGESVVLDSVGGRYFGLNGVGTFVLQAVKQPRQVGELIDLMLNEFDVEKEQLEVDVLAFLEKMESEALVRVEE